MRDVLGRTRALDDKGFQVPDSTKLLRSLVGGITPLTRCEKPPKQLKRAQTRGSYGTSE